MWAFHNNISHKYNIWDWTKKIQIYFVTNKITFMKQHKLYKHFSFPKILISKLEHFSYPIDIIILKILYKRIKLFYFMYVFYFISLTPLIIVRTYMQCYFLNYNVIPTIMWNFAYILSKPLYIVILNFYCGPRTIHQSSSFLNA